MIAHRRHEAIAQSDRPRRQMASQVDRLGGIEAVAAILTSRTKSPNPRDAYTSYSYEYGRGGHTAFQSPAG